MSSSGTYKIRPAGRHILTIGRDLTAAAMLSSSPIMGTVCHGIPLSTNGWCLPHGTNWTDDKALPAGSCRAARGWAAMPRPFSVDVIHDNKREE